MGDLRRPERILNAVGPHNIWRQIHLPGRRRLAAGVGDRDDGLPPDLGGIDFTGKTAVSTGHMNGFLDALQRLLRQEMIISPRLAYHLKKHLGADADELRRKYPEAYIHPNYFFTLDDVHDRFRRTWDMAIVSNAAMTPGTKKETLCFRRINGPAV